MIPNKKCCLGACLLLLSFMPFFGYGFSFGSIAHQLHHHGCSSSFIKSCVSTSRSLFDPDIIRHTVVDVSNLPFTKKKTRKSKTTTVLQQSSTSSESINTTITTDSSCSKDKKSHDNNIVGINSNFFGTVSRIKMGNNDSSFVRECGVPTFLSNASFEESGVVATMQPKQQQRRRRGLEGVLNQGPAFVVDNVLSKDVCEDIIATCESIEFGNFKAGKNHHGAMQMLVSQSLANGLGQILSRHVDVEQVKERHEEMKSRSSSSFGDAAAAATTTTTTRENENDIDFVYSGLNRRWRIYRYAPGGEETFAPHIDAGFPPSGLSQDNTTLIWDDSSSTDETIVSRLTVLMYLNDDFVGGETKFYESEKQQQEKFNDDGNVSPNVIASVRPIQGSVLVFPQAVTEEAVEYARQYWPQHEGSPVLHGNRPKYVIRSDILFSEQVNVPPFE